MLTRFCEAILRERIRKTSAHFFLPDSFSAVQEGAGGMHGGFFGAGLNLKYIIPKLSQPFLVYRPSLKGSILGIRLGHFR
jgi:hypothetical protein